MIYNLISYLFKFFEYFTSNYYEFKAYKKNNINNSNNSNNYYERVNTKICLLMQGPLIEIDNFTYETLKFYKSFNHNTIIIFSTWVNQKIELINNIKKLGIHVIENKLPENKGILNVNLQIISTNKGLELAHLFNCEYVLKTRSDQRIYEYTNLYSYLLSILNLHPIDNNELKNRLIISSLNTFQNRLYGVSDMFMFGRLCDMNKFWNIPLQENKILPNDVKNETFISYNIGEGAFVMNFFNATNFKPKWNKIDSGHFFSKYFYILNKEDISLFWLKYKRHDGFNYYNNNSKSLFFSRYNTSKWIVNYTNFKSNIK
jgi:hypothetical protein